MEYLSCHWFERTNEEYLRDYRWEGLDMAYKCKLFVALTQHFMGVSIFV